MARVAIVGAGIGGLTAAIALRRKGVDVTLYEQAPEARAVGAGLHLWNNAVRALAEIGVADELRPIWAEIQREEIRRSDGTLFAAWPIDDLERAMGVPSITVTRPALVARLVAAVGADAIRLGERLERFEDCGDGVTLRFASGAEERCDVLVGADGLGSTVRAQLHGAADPRYQGYTSWRTLVSNELDDVSLPTVRQYWGRGDRFVYFPAGPEHLYLVALANAPRGVRDGDGGAKPALLERYAGYVDPIPSLVGASDPSGWVRTDIVDRNPLKRWGWGRVTLLGDAAHPMTPNTSQGAGMAIEDAAVLARSLAEAGVGEQALRLYEGRRRKRAGGQIPIARTAGRLGRAQSPVAVAARDRLIRLMFGRVVWSQLTKQTVADF